MSNPGTLAATTVTAPNPPFREGLLPIIHDLIDLPISHGLIGRMKQLEDLLVHYEAREFSYSSYRGPDVLLDKSFTIFGCPGSTNRIRC